MALQMPCVNPAALESAQASMARIVRLYVGPCRVCKTGPLAHRFQTLSIWLAVPRLCHNSACATPERVVGATSAHAVPGAAPLWLGVRATLEYMTLL